MYEKEKESLKRIITGTDLEQYLTNETQLEFAIEKAVAAINERRRYRGEGYEARYKTNVLEGAVYNLSKIGGEGYSGMSENGISAVFKDVPDYLMSVTPRIGTVI